MKGQNGHVTLFWENGLTDLTDLGLKSSIITTGVLMYQPDKKTLELCKAIVLKKCDMSILAFHKYYIIDEILKVLLLILPLGLIIIPKKELPFQSKTKLFFYLHHLDTPWGQNHKNKQLFRKH